MIISLQEQNMDKVLLLITPVYHMYSHGIIFQPGSVAFTFTRTQSYVLLLVSFQSSFEQNYLDNRLHDPDCAMLREETSKFNPENDCYLIRKMTAAVFCCVLEFLF